MPRRMPTDLYSETKYVAEQAVLNSNSQSFDTLVLRPPFVWGPDNPHIELIRDRVERGLFFWVNHGKHRLSTCHVKNLASAIMASLSSDRSGEVYFVTDGEQRSFKDFLSSYAQTQGVDLPEKSLPRWLALGSAKLVRYVWKRFNLNGEPPILPVLIYLLGTHMTISDQKARRELGYENAISMDQGFQELHDPALN